MVKAVWLVIPLFSCHKLHLPQSSGWAELITLPCQNSHFHVSSFMVRWYTIFFQFGKFCTRYKHLTKFWKACCKKKECHPFPYPTSWTANHQHQPRLQLAPAIVSFFNFYFNTSVKWSFSSSSNSNMQCANTCWLFIMFQSIILNSMVTNRRLKGNIR